MFAGESITDAGGGLYQKLPERLSGVRVVREERAKSLKWSVREKSSKSGLGPLLKTYTAAQIHMETVRETGRKVSSWREREGSERWQNWVVLRRLLSLGYTFTLFWVSVYLMCQINEITARGDPESLVAPF